MDNLYSQKQTAQKLGLTVPQFLYMIKHLNYEPHFRAGDKGSNVLYSKDQLKELDLAVKLKKQKYSYPVVKEVLQKIKNTDNKDLWIINIENTEQFKVCTDDEVPTVVSDIVKRGKRFLGGKITVAKTDKSKSRELQTA